MLHSDALRVQQLLQAGSRADLLSKLHLCQRHLVRKHLNMTSRQSYPPPRSIFDSFLGRRSAEEGREVPLLVAIDSESDGGLGGTSEDLFGPLAVLLVGFAQYEVDQFRSFMIDMDADMVKILSCTKQMLSSTLEEALTSAAPTFEQLPLGTKRAVFLSGMCSAEVQEVISAYNDSGLPPTVWAAAVPANYDRAVSVLLEDIYGDHNLMMQIEQDYERRQRDTGS